MILAFDTYYFEDSAKTVCIQFEKWTDSVVTHTYEETLSGIEEYKSGEFYKRELPCILSLLNQINLSGCEAIVIDGFVVLDDEQNPGLGDYLYTSLESKIPVIGVAKNNYSRIQEYQREIFRGDSHKALHITAKGIDLDIAAGFIQSMTGPYRIPDLLKKVDGIGRGNV